MINYDTAVVRLEHEQWNFIVLGLRDAADAAEKRAKKWFSSREDRAMEWEIAIENRMLANQIEADVFGKRGN